MNGDQHEFVLYTDTVCTNRNGWQLIILFTHSVCLMLGELSSRLMQQLNDLILWICAYLSHEEVNFDHYKIYAMRRLFTPSFCYDGLFLASILELYFAEFTLKYFHSILSTHRWIKMLIAFLLLWVWLCVIENTRSKNLLNVASTTLNFLLCCFSSTFCSPLFNYLTSYGRIEMGT